MVNVNHRHGAHKSSDAADRSAVSAESDNNNMGDFQPFGVSHCSVLAIIVCASAGLVLYGRRIRGGAMEWKFQRAFALVVLTVEVAFQVYAMLPGHWGLDHSLPFELCDLAWMAAVVGLWTRRPLLCCLLYYWGLTLTTQAILTPKLRPDFPDPVFLMFFISHALTVLAAVYLTFAAGAVRPTWRIWAHTCLITVAWGALMLAFNAATGANYLFVNHKPPTASALDYFGPWPFYLLVEIAAGASVWALMTWPWTRRRTLDITP